MSTTSLQSLKKIQDFTKEYKVSVDTHYRWQIFATLMRIVGNCLPVFRQ
jgi:hypothetical protein